VSRREVSGKESIAVTCWLMVTLIQLSVHMVGSGQSRLAGHLSSTLMLAKLSQCWHVHMHMPMVHVSKAPRLAHNR
jgi:C4-dicarboxylate transporter